jgi:hypothetical protein
VGATKAVSPLPGAASYRHVAKQLLMSVVQEICMLCSVGARERATAPGHPVVPREWYRYRDLIDRLMCAHFSSGLILLSHHP